MSFEDELRSIGKRQDLINKQGHLWSNKMYSCFKDKLEHDILVLHAKKELKL